MAERLVWVDAARTLACGLVVVVHVNIYGRAGLETWWPLGFWTVPLYSVAVPSFLVLSGYLSRTADTTSPNSGGGIARLAVPFLIWNVATSLALAAAGSRPNLQTTVFRLLTGTWQLYFIFVLLQLRLFDRLTRERSGETPVLVLSALVTTATWALGDLLLWKTQGADAGAFELTVERLFPCWLIFFVLGTWLRRHPRAFDAVTKRLPLLVVAILLAWALYVLELRLEESRFGYNPRKQILLGGLPFQMLSPLLALSVLRALDRSRRARSFLLVLAAAGRHTFGIYLCHTVVLIGVFALARAARVELPGSWEVPPLAAATWVLSLGLLGLVRAVAPAWLLFAAFGEEKKHPAPLPTTVS